MPSKAATKQDSVIDQLRPQVTNELLATIAGRIARRFNPEKIILFGSHAYGRPGGDSDVDLLVIVESSERPAARSVPIRLEAHVPYLPMDLIALTPDEVRDRLDAADPFMLEVVKKGRVLFSRANSQ